MAVVLGGDGAAEARRHAPVPTYLDCGHETIAVTMAAAYTTITGRMQAVLLHAGAGLLQGSMAVGAARAMETPMLVMSGESLGYGESDFDPGLAVVSQPERGRRVAAAARAGGEMGAAGARPRRRFTRASCAPARWRSARPKDRPTSASRWRRCCTSGAAGAAAQGSAGAEVQPQRQTSTRVAALLAKAKCPVISVENAGPDQEAFDALVELAELRGDSGGRGRRARSFANFPKSHDLYLGANINRLLKEMDLALLIESRAPWYPPSNAADSNATIVAIGESPLKGPYGLPDHGGRTIISRATSR